MRVFFSHSHRDKPLVAQLVRELPPWLRPWVDTDELFIGVRLAARLKEAIDAEVDFVVLMFNRDAAESAWVGREVAWALRQEVELDRTFLLPVVTDESRDRLRDFGLQDRLTLRLANHDTGGIRLLADELASNVAGHMVTLLDADRAPARHADSLHALTKQTIGLVAAIPGDWRADVETLLMRPFVDELVAIRIGIVPLTAVQYYQRVFLEMAQARSGSKVLAVSTLSSDLWNRDADQTHYAALNLEALGRRAAIKRLFILPEAGPLAYEDIIRRQEKAGVDTRVGSTEILARVPDLDDFVIFETDSGARGYVARPSIVGTRPIRSGSLVLSDTGLAKRRDALAAAWGTASAPDAFFRRHRSTQTATGVQAAPGLTLHARELESPVVSCEEAAAARDIPLARELKTLLLQTHNRIVAAHLPGDGTLSLRKVKTVLATAQAYLASPEDLADLGLSEGTICAVLEPVWSMTHLISRRLMTIDSVMTNNGTRTGYFEFDPAVLAKAADVIVDDLEQ
jgi:prolyl-tRNA editing enzyme YbaK/EbsC (Cys-tRNA(Pro) deacylase)